MGTEERGWIADDGIYVGDDPTGPTPAPVAPRREPVPPPADPWDIEVTVGEPQPTVVPGPGQPEPPAPPAMPPRASRPPAPQRPSPPVPVPPAFQAPPYPPRHTEEPGVWAFRVEDLPAPPSGPSPGSVTGASATGGSVTGGSVTGFPWSVPAREHPPTAAPEPEGAGRPTLAFDTGPVRLPAFDAPPRPAVITSPPAPPPAQDPPPATGPAPETGPPAPATGPRARSVVPPRAAVPLGEPAGRPVAGRPDAPPPARRSRLPIVAVVVVVLALAGYVLLRDSGGNGPADPATSPPAGTGSTGPSASPSPTTRPTRRPTSSNPAAKAGAALVGGTYRCYQGSGSAFRRIPEELEVPRASGVYLWDGARGTYTISRQTYSTATDVFSTVSFTSGPLRGVDATYLNRVRQGDAGLDSGGLVFKDGSDRYCAVN